MSISIQIPTVLRRFTENLDQVEVDGANVREALQSLVWRHPHLRKHLYDDAGSVRSFVNVYLGDQDVRHLPAKHDTRLNGGEVLTIVPSIAGGSGRNGLPPLTQHEIRAYSRHLLLPEVGAEGQRKLKAASVLVIGAGGLGSPLLAYLSAAGVGRIGIVDLDVVDETNLQRQIIHGVDRLGASKLESARQFIRNLNPRVQVDLHETYLSSENARSLAAGYDILVDGTDNFPTRYLVNDVAYLLGKPNVYGSIFRFEGQASVFCTEGGPCYRCLYPEPPPPGLVPSCAEGGVLGVLPGIVGSIQATEVIKLILGVGQSLAGRLLRFDALGMKFREFVLQRDPACPLCGDRPSIHDLIDYHEFCGLPASQGSVSVPVENQIDVKQLHALLEHGNGHRPVLLDVRLPEELEISALPGAQLIPIQELEYRLHEVERERDVVIFCRSGRRSAQAWYLLRDAGFRNPMYNLEGGILAWAEQIDPTMALY
ncbi:molybdopterin-synthase adenylyltransferase MoeB [candidate division KSB1 bacterium]|nr:molybdopterin-synthase adenylyltransferase MoeB [candidate division KSB1 bacterium]